MLSAILRLALVVACLSGFVQADKPAFAPQDADRYDKGMYGRAPVERLRSTDLPAMRLLRREWDEEHCASEDSHYLVATRGREAKAGPVSHAGPVIMDSNGHQVWFGAGYPPMYNFRKQMYRGEQVLTFWAGKEMRGGHGEGTYYILDKHYQEIKLVSAYGNYTADLHEFKIIEGQERDTVLLTSYPQEEWRYDVWPTTQNETDIWDNVFQEIDLETGELLFEWRASDHFKPEDCFNPKPDRRTLPARPQLPPRPQGPDVSNLQPKPPGIQLPNRVVRPVNDVWDWFHINSVDKDAKGNYLISSRYSHSITYIDGQTGEILWQLGGKHNSFTDLSGGRATKLAWQHHATWQDDYTAITVFDNEAVSMSVNRKPPTEVTQSRALKIRLDQEAMTAEVVMEGLHPQRYSTQSQGSIQQLENGNFFVGYGNTAAMTEFSPEGKVVCDFQYGALHYRGGGSFSPGGIQSYRAFKSTGWKGYPLEPPKFAMDANKFYVSWNGATEVREWVLDGKSNSTSQISVSQSWTPAGKTKWTGFESEIAVKKFKYDMFRLTALDRDGKSLGRWLVLPSGSIEPLVETFMESNRVLSTHVLYLSLFLFLAFLLYKMRGILTTLRKPRSQQNGIIGTSDPEKSSRSTLSVVQSIILLSGKIFWVKIFGTKAGVRKTGHRAKDDEEYAEQISLTGHTVAGAREFRDR